MRLLILIAFVSGFLHGCGGGGDAAPAQDAASAPTKVHPPNWNDPNVIR